MACITACAAQSVVRNVPRIPPSPTDRSRHDRTNLPSFPDRTRSRHPGRSCAAPTAAQAETTQEAFIQRVLPAARAEREAWGVPVSISIAQAIIESAWGTSELAVNATNFHGLKCHRTLSRSAGCYTKTTWEWSPERGNYTISADFHRFGSVQNAFHAHGEFLLAPHYASAFRYSDDPYRFLQAIKDGGYATDPNYVSSVWQRVQTYGLTRYDSPSAGQPWSMTRNTTGAGFAASGSWGRTSWSSQNLGSSYRFSQPRSVSDPAWFSARFPETGSYEVEVRHPADRGYSASAPHLVPGAGGTRTVRFDQRGSGGTWRSLGVHRFGAGTRRVLGVSCWTAASGLIVVDGVRITRA